MNRRVSLIGMYDKPVAFPRRSSKKRLGGREQVRAEGSGQSWDRPLLTNQKSATKRCFAELGGR